MNIVPKLTLNKHPKDSQNLSFVTAMNVKISNDESCITNEESIKENTVIDSFLTNYYSNEDDGEYDIISIIPCNNELVIIAVGKNNRTKAQIFRYREKTSITDESIKCVYGDNDNYLSYHNGKIKGTFTYNVENSLIIAISEYDGVDDKVPLKTINLGNFDNDDLYNDRNIPDSKLPTNPEVKIPSITTPTYLAGSAYKGWYYLYIRYKINSVDYTQWYSFGFPIYVDTIEQYQIIRYCFNRDTKFNTGNMAIPIIYPAWPSDGYGAGCSDYFSDNTDIAKETFQTIINGIDTNYDKYQIGLICASKSKTKAFRTADINNNVRIFVLDNKTLIEASAEEFIIDNFNYFNVKSLFNYKNKLYIANYKENNPNNRKIDLSLIDNIKADVTVSFINEINSVVSDSGLVVETNGNKTNQYDIAYGGSRIYLHDFLNIDKEANVTIDYTGGKTQDKAKNFFITTINSNDDGSTVLHEYNNGFICVGHFKYKGIGVYEIEYLTDLNTNYFGITNDDDPSSQYIRFTIKKTGLNISTNKYYINTKNGFNIRKVNSSLIPGEVYNFFIHFVDKYGHSTNGYRINNNVKYYTEEDINKENEVFPVRFKSESEDTYLYAAVGIDSSIRDVLNYNNVTIYKIKDKVNHLLKQPYDKSSAVYNEFKNEFISFNNDNFLNTKWYQITLPYDDEFSLYINNNGDRLFRVPFSKSFRFFLNFDPGNEKPYNTTWSHTIYNPNFSNIKVPEGYVGYFISYEKYEPLQRATGLLTRNDFRTISKMYDTYLYTANHNKSNSMMFYSSIFDTSDSLKLDYNIIRIEGVDVFDKSDIPPYDFMQRNISFSFMHDQNKPQIKTYECIRNYAIPKYKIGVGGSAVDNRQGQGSCLIIDDAYNLFPVYNQGNNIKLYRATILNCTRDIYMSNNKTLIRLTDIKYINDNNGVYNTGNIVSGLNGHYTYDGVLVYENAGLSFNETDNKARRFINNSLYYPDSVGDSPNHHTYYNDIPFVNYVQFPICSDVFFESKRFKNEPKAIVYLTKTDESDATKNTFYGGTMVVPNNSIDLFENPQGSSDQFDPKTYTNFREDLVSIDTFNKTVRRSNIIQDESRINGWRKFSVESYKNITENKGEITNIIGIGTMLLIHTQHSLFMFDTDNTLTTNDKAVQLSQPDAFDVEYKEVFTSSLGFGGLQDDKAFAIDQFGYIFYNNDFNRFYRFDNGQLAYIDDDIIEWLNKYKPYNIRFANDKNNNRLIIKMNYKVNDNTEDNIVISYNYNTKNFVSFHSYYFDESFNTKSNLYLKCDYSRPNCSLHQFVKNNSSYGEFDNSFKNARTPVIHPSKIGIIVNDVYSEIKFLETITYKLNKVANSEKIAYNYSPVEGNIQPFAGNYITVYNNEVNTGKLDVSVNTEESKNTFGKYNKPYWELGNWNFSYLRNNIANYNNYGDSFNMSRIFGNYFIVEFEFSNEDKCKVEFEDFNYNIVK